MIEASEVGFKNRMTLVTFVLTSLFISISIVLIYKEQQRNFEYAKTEFKTSLHRGVKQTINTSISHYKMMADTVLNTTKAKELMKEGKREALYKLLRSKWKLWTEIDPNFKVMLFHKADGTAFLRMHKPEVYDDYLSDIRPMVKAAHEQQRVLTGYETGKYSTVFRLLTPIFYQGEYLGSLDFGINLNHFTKAIHAFTGHKGVFFVKEENLKLFKRDASFSLNGYLLQSSVNEDVLSLLERLPSSYSFSKNVMLEIENHYYSVYAYSMNDFKDERKAHLLFFHDITKTVTLQREFTIILALTGVFFSILMYFLLKNSFNRLSSSLKKVHDTHMSELKEAQRLTVFNEKLLHAVFDTSQNIIISTIGKETLFSVNKAFLKFTGFESMNDFIKDHECVSEIFEEVDDEDYLAKDKDGVHWIDYIHLHPSKTFKVKILKEAVAHIFLVNASEMNLDEKNRNVFSFTDITELVHYQEKIQEQDALLYKQSKMAAMGEMISMIAHQWRQPLSSIAAATSVLKMRMALEDIRKDELGKTLDNIDKYVQYMSKTINDFRNFYRPDKRKEPVLLSEVVESALSIVKLFIENHNITIHTRYETQEPVFTYSNELVQVLLNLMQNAKDVLLESQTPDARISLSVIKNGEDKQSIIISDNNGGVPEELMDKIFEPYFTTKDKLNGTGLGLYMSKTIIEEHCGGTIRVENNNGANFIITIPIKSIDDSDKRVREEV